MGLQFDGKLVLCCRTSKELNSAQFKGLVSYKVENIMGKVEQS